MEMEQLKKALRAQIEEYKTLAFELSDQMAREPEIGSQEYKSSAAIVKLLRDHGVEVEYPFAGYRTAFRGQICPERKVRMALLAEYDALRGLGHACGHCASGSGSVLAALAFQAFRDEYLFGVDIIGTPDEEYIGTKIGMAEKGIFDGYDFVAMVHMGPQTTAEVQFIALDGIGARWHGKPAHAAGEPWSGRNALNAARLFFDATDAMRQHIIPEARMDEKIAVLDTVDQHFGADWFANLEKELDGRQPDYLVVHHMEPDHSANIGSFAAKYPNAKIVASLPAFNMMKKYYETDFPAQKMVVKEGSTLALGKHTLTFIGAAMVHWPEVLMSYESTEKVLFTADAFGKFGALDVEEDWACEARRYYIGIVGKFGAQVQTVLKKAAALDIQTICPLHGPVLTENLGYYINLYNIWSSYAVESEGVMIAYSSVYGNTKKAVEYLAEELKAKGCPKVVVCDLAREDMAEAVEDAFRYGKLVLATTTYNGDIFPFMRTFIDHLTERNFQNRKIALVENGSWAPVAAKVMAKALEGSKNIELAGTVTIRGALKEENKRQLAELAAGLMQ